MVEVCGMGYMEGTSKKSGKPYQGYMVHYTERVDRPGFSGFEADHCFIPSSALSQPLKIGDKLELHYDRRGFLQKVEVV